MVLTIPDAHQQSLIKLLSLSPEVRQNFLDAIKASKPTLVLPHFAKQVGQSADIPVSDAMSYLSLLGSLFLFGEAHGLRPAAIAVAVSSAVESHALKDWSDASERKQFDDFLTDALGLRTEIGVLTKALDVLVQDPHPLASARIITELRPVFLGESEGMTIAAGMIVHSLKLSSLKSDGSEEDYFVSMDCLDLREFKQVIDRAMKKEKSLQRMFEASDIPCIGRGTSGPEA
ncbi:MAG: hypothetical protein F4139_12170 [Gemmatimonadetes bacterium]|nr:hypothetical protein [Gemmatimonadota bacterium]MYH53675.1 hypothetical protein [Gemmatimonadota bacterium]MYK65094.1 hypothetical protein [Gemmatimonadota bacterium]